MNSTFAKKLLKICKSANKIAISGHKNPDYDAISSALAVQEILSQNSISADIVLETELDNSFAYYKETRKFVIEPKQKYDVLICVDSAEIKMLPNFVAEMLGSVKHSFNIDHHSNSNYAAFNFVKVGISSCCEVIYYLFKKHFKLTQTMAEALYMGIYTDTGGFVYSNTAKDTFACLADLIGTGINASQLLLKCFRSKTINEFEITKKAFNSIQFYDNGRIAVSILRENDFKETNATLNDSKFIVPYLPTIQGVDVGISITEPGDGEVHVSLRTSNDEVDVSKIARNFGGGGHVKASGLTLKGDFDKAVTALINYTKYTLENKN